VTAAQRHGANVHENTARQAASGKHGLDSMVYLNWHDRGLTQQCSHEVIGATGRERDNMGMWYGTHADKTVAA